jgi:hypothetical protein
VLREDRGSDGVELGGRHPGPDSTPHRIERERDDAPGASQADQVAL